MATLGKLLVELSANTATFQRDMGRAAQIMDKRMRTIEGSAKRVDRALLSVSKAAGALAGIIAGGIFVNLGRQALDNADRVAKLATRLGESTENLSQYGFVAERAGVQFQNFGRALQVQQRLISDAANGYGQAQDALRELGLNSSELQSLAPTEQFRRLSEALRSIESESRRVALAQKVWQSEGVQLLQVVNQGNEAIESQLQRARDLGAVLSGDTAKAAEDANDAMYELGVATEALARSFAILAASPLADFFSTLARGVGRVSDFFKDLTASANELSLGGVRDELRSVQDQIVKTRAEIAELESDLENPSTSIIDMFTRGSEEDTKRKIAELRAELQRLVELQDELTRREGQLVNRRPPVSIAPQPEPSSEPAARRAALAGPVRRFQEFPTRPTPASGTVDSLFVYDNTAQTMIDETNKGIEETGKQLIDASAAARDLGFTFESAFENAIIGGMKLRDVLKGLLQDIARIVIRQTITAPLAAAITGGLQSAFAGAGGSGAATYGTRALGGPVSAGSPYLVGEKGVELFVPDSSGSIIPNDQLSASAPAVNVNITALDARSVQQLMVEQRGTFVSMMADAFARRGQRVNVG